jgi:hypothetical protein
MRSILAVLVFAIGCTSSDSGTSQPQLDGDTCAVHLDQTDCLAQSGCNWYAYGRPCPNDGSYCPAGVCQSAGSGSGSGSGSAGAACACSDGGVCFEQLGGPAQQGSGASEVGCTTPAPGDGDPCARIEGQGTCSDSDQVSGLCVCDNGVR